MSKRDKEEVDSIAHAIKGLEATTLQWVNSSRPQTFKRLNIGGEQKQEDQLELLPETEAQINQEAAAKAIIKDCTLGIDWSDEGDRRSFMKELRKAVKEKKGEQG